MQLKALKVSAKRKLEFERTSLPSRWLLSGAIFFLTIAVITSDLSADVLEWEISNPETIASVEGALTRFFRVVRKDSTAVRYLESASIQLPLHVRARTPGFDEEYEVIMVRYGQLQLFESAEIQIALGDVLYRRIVASRSDVLSDRPVINLGDQHGHNDWQNDNTITLSLFERLDVRIADRLNIFLQLGAPESNRDFWSDGTARIGLAGPVGELAFLLPYSGGSKDFGPVPGRLLSPGIGAFARIRSHPVELSARFTLPFTGSLSSTRPIDEVYVPLISTTAALEAGRFTGVFGTISINVGLSFEDVVKVIDSDGSMVVRAGSFRRLGPVVELVSETPNETILLSVGTRLLALRATASIRVTSSIWFDFRLTKNGLVQDLTPYESEFAFFFTPRIRF